MSDDTDAPGLKMPALRPGQVPCQACGQTTDPVVRVGPIAICAHCGASNVVEADGTVRRATALDTESLMPGDRATLVKARSSIVRPRLK